jgi:hypothetical protein
MTQFRRNGIDSVVINPIPPINEKNVQWDKDTYLDFSLLYNCHSRDTVETIDTMDMKEFVEDVVLKY